jgi:hypothetical protein
MKHFNFDWSSNPDFIFGFEAASKPVGFETQTLLRPPVQWAGAASQLSSCKNANTGNRTPCCGSLAVVVSRTVMRGLYFHFFFTFIYRVYYYSWSCD